MELMIYLLVGLSVALCLWSLLSILGQRKQMSKSVRSMTHTAPLLIRMLLPVAQHFAKTSQSYAEKLNDSGTSSEHPFLRLREYLKRCLITAGNPGDIIADEVFGLCVVSAFLTGLLIGSGAMAVGYPVEIFAFFALILGFFLPFFWLNDRMNRRRISIRKDLPYMLDLFTLCVEAGLDFTTALNRLVPKFSESPLGYELGTLMHELQIGKSRVEGLKDLAWRINLIEMTTVTNAITQAEKLGSSIGPILRIQSEDARRRRGLRAEELAMKAPVKLLFPLAAFIFPTTFLIIFGPIFIKNLPFLQSLGK